MRKRAWNFEDLSGKKINHLYVTELVEVKKGIKWKCLCDCGNYTLVDPAKLKSGHTKSCGCLIGKSIAQRSTTHGLSKHPLKGVYNTMKQRCFNKNTHMYYRYGGRGISVCKQWKDDFVSFYNWAINNGYRKGLSIDRINNDGNYEPSNCRWITISENIAKEAKISKEKRISLIKMYLDKSNKVKDIALSFDIDESRIYQILKEENIERKRYK